MQIYTKAMVSLINVNVSPIPWTLLVKKYITEIFEEVKK